jgi:hypothetical protein
VRFTIEGQPAAQLAAGFFHGAAQGKPKQAKFMFCLDFGRFIS